MKKSEHLKIHKQLHTALDQLVVDYVEVTYKNMDIDTLPRITDLTVMQLIRWSHEQTIDPELPVGQEHDPE